MQMKTWTRKWRWRNNYATPRNPPLGSLQVELRPLTGSVIAA